MRWLTILLLTLGLAGAAYGLRPEWFVTKEVRILFIGNSYTQVNDLPGMVARLSRQSGQAKVVFDAEIRGGFTLEKHWEAGRAADKIRQGHWDYVVLQEQSLRPLDNPELLVEYGERFAALIRQSGGRTLLYVPWARQGAAANQAKINAAYADLAKRSGAELVMVGDAWQAALQTDPALLLYSSDGSHPAPLGTYLAACTFVAKLYGISPEKIKGGLEGYDKATLQKVCRVVR